MTLETIHMLASKIISLCKTNVFTKRDTLYQPVKEYGKSVSDAKYHVIRPVLKNFKINYTNLVCGIILKLGISV